MRGAGFWTVVLASVLAALLAAPARASLETIVQDDGVLLYSSPEQLRAAAQRLRLLGVDRVRITANWSVLTRASAASVRPAFDASDPGAYEQARWSNLDAAVQAVDEAGLRVMIDIGFWAPRWATSAPPGPRARTNVKPRDYAAFATAVARRYSGAFVIPRPAPGEQPPPPADDANALAQLLAPLLGRSPVPPPPATSALPPATPLPRVDVLTLWNEPNHPGLLLPQWEHDHDTPASPAIYRRMVQAAYPAVKRVRPGARVLIGNTSSVGGTRGHGAVAPLEFAASWRASTGACAAARPAPARTSGASPVTAGHIIRTPATNGRTSAARAAATTSGWPNCRCSPGRCERSCGAGASRPLTRIYITEFGFETKRVPGRPTVSASDQARWLTWSEYLADRVPAVRSFAQFLLRDQPPAATVVSDSLARPFGQFSTGLLHADGSPKMAARTFRAGLFAQLRRGGRVLLYGRLRLGHGRQAITLQRRAGGGRWRTIASFSTDGQAAFTRTVRSRPDAIYRLTFPGSLGRRRAGLAIRPVRAAG